MTDLLALPFDHRFVRLPESFYTRMQPEGFARDPWLIHGNPSAAALLGLDETAFGQPDFARYFSGSLPLPGSHPLAMVYSGHQFGHWAGQLGDGRALLLGQLRDPAGALWDIQLKGGGTTPYSRMGDGRAVLRSCIREYLCSEAMHALGIPTTRALCIVGTGEAVWRETPEPGAVLTRLARSHIRFGHFEHFFHRGQLAEVRLLAEHVMDEYFPELEPGPDRPVLWFAEIVRRTAEMIARWQAVGFAHGVMNTDNMSILGLTLDYGPFGFMEAFDPHFICNHSDDSGRYAFDQQPAIGLWNLHALAHALQPVLGWEDAAPALKEYGAMFTQSYRERMREKLCLVQNPHADQDIGEDDRLWTDLLALAAKHRADYVHVFRLLGGATTQPATWLALFDRDPGAQEWLARYHARMACTAIADDLLREAIHRANPKYVLRNWVAETAIRAAEDEKDYGPIGTLLTMLAHPFDEQDALVHYAGSAPEIYRNLCVSCSS